MYTAKNKNAENTSPDFASLILKGLPA